MKKIFTLLTIISLIITSYSQTGNPSFETWESPLLTNEFEASAEVYVAALGGNVEVFVCSNTFSYNELTHWSSTNQLTNASDLGGVELISSSTDAVDGLKSIKIESKNTTLTGHAGSCNSILSETVDNVSPGLMVSGSFQLDIQQMIEEITTGAGLNALNPFNTPGVGEPINFIPKTISGQYKYTGGVDTTHVDSCIIVSGLKKNGVLIGTVVGRFGNAASWTSFSLSYDHLNCETPDTIVTVISSSSIDLEIIDGEFNIITNYAGVDGSVMLVDALHLDTILPSEFPPILINDEATIITIDSAIVPVLDNDYFCDGAFPIVLNYSGTEGVAILNSDEEIEFNPAPGFIGTVVIPYYSCNSLSLCDTAILTIVVNPIPACIAYDDYYTLDANSSIEEDSRLNDIDCGTVISITSNPPNGLATVLSNNNINYVPNTNYSGDDSLEYSICSELEPTQCSTAKIYFGIVSGINEIDDDLLNFYPNPANNVLNISLDVISEVEVTIFNTVGQNLYSTSFNRELTIDLQSYVNGIYFVEIETNGKKSVRKLQVIK